MNIQQTTTLTIEVTAEEAENLRQELDHSFMMGYLDEEEPALGGLLQALERHKWSQKAGGSSTS